MAAITLSILAGGFYAMDGSIKVDSQGMYY